MKITDEAVEALSVSLIGAAWKTFDEGLLGIMRGVHRQALEAALPHMTEDGAATPPADTGVRSTQAAESATGIGVPEAAPSSSDRQALKYLLSYHYYDAKWSKQHQGFRCVCGWLGEDHVEHVVDLIAGAS